MEEKDPQEKFPNWNYFTPWYKAGENWSSYSLGSESTFPSDPLSLSKKNVSTYWDDDSDNRRETSWIFCGGRCQKKSSMIEQGHEEKRDQENLSLANSQKKKIETFNKLTLALQQQNLDSWRFEIKKNTWDQVYLHGQFLLV